MTLPQAINYIRPSIVQISYVVRGFLSPELRSIVGKNMVSGSLGTGFVVGDGSFVVTAAHVIRAGQNWLQPIQAAEKYIEISFAIPRHSGTESFRASFIGIAFQVVSIDEQHDLALLKLMQNPVATKVSSAIAGRAIAIKAIPVTIDTTEPVDGSAVAVSGYPLNEQALLTTSGNMATSASFNSVTVQLPGAPVGFTVPDIADVYLADVTANHGNSGAPVYSIETGNVIGVCTGGKLAPVEDQPGQAFVDVNGRTHLYASGLTVVVPAKYVGKLLRSHGVSLNPATTGAHK